MGRVKWLAVYVLVGGFSHSAFSEWFLHCGNVKRLYSWAAGSDTYGARVILKENPSSCGGFWIQHEGDNKNLVYSTLLASSASGQRVVYNSIQSKPNTMDCVD